MFPGRPFAIMSLLSKRRILVIDDDDMLREVMVFALREAGYEPFEASSGERGIDLALRSHLDLILCDLMMPGLDGFGVLVRLRAEPKTAGIPFIFITSSSAAEDSRLGILLGANDYVTKPVESAKLLKLIEQRLSPKNVP